MSRGATITFVAAGLDVSKDTVVCCVLLPSGEEAVARWSVGNTQPGATALAARLAEICHTQQIPEVRIGIEATGVYWWHLACALHAAPELAQVAHPVYALNPSWVHALRPVYADLGKTDRRDAFLIAERLRVGRLPAPFQIDTLYLPLQRLTRFRFHLVHTLAREKQYFLSMLFLAFSGFTQAEPFSDPFGTTSLALLESFTSEEVSQLSLEDLAAFLQEKGRGRFTQPAQIAQTLQQAARDSFRLDKVLHDPLKLVLGTTMATIRTLTAQVHAVDRTIAQELNVLPPDRRTITSIPGLGSVWVAALLAEIGAIERFPDDAALAKFAGLVWNPKQSGTFQAEDTPLAKSGNTYLRYSLIEAANSVRQHCAEYQQYYHTKLVQSPKHAHKRALVLTARKLVRLIEALLRTGTVYRSPEHRQDRKEPLTAPGGARPRSPRRTAVIPPAH